MINFKAPAKKRAEKMDRKYPYIRNECLYITTYIATEIYNNFCDQIR